MTLQELSKRTFQPEKEILNYIHGQPRNKTTLPVIEGILTGVITENIAVTVGVGMFLGVPLTNAIEYVNARYRNDWIIAKRLVK